MGYSKVSGISNVLYFFDVLVNFSAKPCTGPSTRYVSCNVDACPSGAEDFRALQCSEHDDTPLDGNYYKWLPYPGKNKCELTCKPDNANFYYKWADKVSTVNIAWLFTV